MRNETFLKALSGQQTDYTPVWLMRQAGRYLPEYRDIRARAGGFMNLCRNVDLACQVSLQPLDRFALDAAILFSDILTIPDAMDLGLYFEEGHGPRFQKPIRSEQDIDKLPSIKPQTDLGYVCAIASQLSVELSSRVPLIGFAGSPWTIATYMIEGKSPGNFRISKSMMYEQPELLEALIEKLVVAVTDYLCAQIEAGVDAIQIFDTWGGVLAENEYCQFSLASISRVLQGIYKRYPGTPSIVFTKGGGIWLNHLVDCGARALGIDWTYDLGRARELVAGKVSLQGNLDPAILASNPSVIKQHTRNMLDSYGSYPGHIANLGHGITPDIDPKNVTVFVDEVHKYSEQQQQSSKYK